jgi:hypothetical protein
MNTGHHNAGHHEDTGPAQSYERRPPRHDDHGPVPPHGPGGPLGTPSATDQRAQTRPMPPAAPLRVHHVTVRLTPTRGIAARPLVDRHLRVVLPAPHPWPVLADVLVSPGTDASAADALAAAHPGAAVIAVHDGAGMCWLRVDSGGVVRLTLTARHAALCSWPAWASLAHAWLVAGLPPAELPELAALPGAAVRETATAAGHAPPGAAVSETVTAADHALSVSSLPSSANPRRRRRTSSAGTGRPTAR